MKGFFGATVMPSVALRVTGKAQQAEHQRPVDWRLGDPARNAPRSKGTDISDEQSLQWNARHDGVPVLASAMAIRAPTTRSSSTPNVSWRIAPSCPISTEDGVPRNP